MERRQRDRFGMKAIVGGIVATVAGGLILTFILQQTGAPSAEPDAGGAKGVVSRLPPVPVQRDIAFIKAWVDLADRRKLDEAWAQVTPGSALARSGQSAFQQWGVAFATLSVDTPPVRQTDGSYRAGLRYKYPNGIVVKEVDLFDVTRTSSGRRMSRHHFLRRCDRVKDRPCDDL